MMFRDGESGERRLEKVSLAGFDVISEVVHANKKFTYIA